jgi:hypothetical protein
MRPEALLKIGPKLLILRAALRAHFPTSLWRWAMIAVKNLALLHECPPWLRGTLGGSSIET